MDKKKIVWLSAAAAATVAGGLAWGTRYLFDYALGRGTKDFLSPTDASGQESAPTPAWDFTTMKPERLSLLSADGLRLTGLHFKQEGQGQRKLAVIVHGYTGQGQEMTSFAALFAELGFDLFLPDARAHGQSEGDYIGFGWPDRLDLVQWLEQLVGLYPADLDIVLFGISMGAATVMMAAGEPLPPQVKVIIEDCGYDSVEHELSHQLKELFHLPAFPLVPLTSRYAAYKAGYNFTEASAVTQLQKSTLPTLFIHGTADRFVPTEMIYPLYEATQGPKEMYLVPEAKHAEAFKQDPAKYKQVVTSFLTTYLEKEFC